MIFIKSAIVTLAITFFSAGDLALSQENNVDTASANVVEEYCYNLTVNVNGMSITATGCGSTPQAGLNELGSAVRHLAEMRN